MNALKWTLALLVLCVALAPLIDASTEDEEESRSLEKRSDPTRRPPHSRHPIRHRHHPRRPIRRRPHPRRPTRPRNCLKRCSVRCRYGSCTCRVTKDWYSNRRRRCPVCCECKCDRRGFAMCHEQLGSPCRHRRH
ncbi:hypothetical protein NP493_6649g00016 [Ridgeia piscesae]|uniref:Uncharacterized protein n=1 Tax=Ridgeia piscesae TaxID=27915 RepID=A0AAD9IQM0_RIDPI|nr:hypothetical protein NP493_6649g00016 [Ridgeia piscesae]